VGCRRIRVTVTIKVILKLTLWALRRFTTRGSSLGLGAGPAEQGRGMGPGGLRFDPGPKRYPWPTGHWVEFMQDSILIWIKIKQKQEEGPGLRPGSDGGGGGA
jgi:hypothetical protein